MIASRLLDQDLGLAWEEVDLGLDGMMCVWLCKFESIC